MVVGTRDEVTRGTKRILVESVVYVPDFILSKTKQKIQRVLNDLQDLISATNNICKEAITADVS